MKVLELDVKAKDFIDLIDNRMAMIDIKYSYAVADNDKIKAEVYAESKWQLAELKMQVADYLVNSLDKKLNNE